MTPDQLARRLGLRIRRKRDGSLQLMRGNHTCSRPDTMAGIDSMLDSLRRAHNEGMTFTTACGMPMYTTEPAKRKI